MPRLRVMTLVLAGALAAACGDSAAVSPGAGSPAGSTSAASLPTSAGASASADPSGSLPRSPEPSRPSPGPTSGPSATASPAASGGGPDISGVTDLRALLPDILGGHALIKSLFTGTDFAASPGAISNEMRALLGGLGRDVTDLRMAVATDPSATIDVTVTAFRVRDVQARAFFEAYVPVIIEAFPGATVNETTFGSKTAYGISLDSKSSGTSSLYPLDDVLFVVTGSDVQLVGEAFGLLP